ncbi:MAG: hypothetical protein ACLTYO_15230 [Blautia obeum]
MNKHGIRLITAVVTSSMIVTPVLAAPSVDDLKKEKHQNRMKSVVTVTAYNIDGKG